MVSNTLTRSEGENVKPNDMVLKHYMMLAIKRAGR